jgi:hypothetical protein
MGFGRSGQLLRSGFRPAVPLESLLESRLFPFMLDPRLYCRIFLETGEIGSSVHVADDWIGFWLALPIRKCRLPSLKGVSNPN